MLPPVLILKPYLIKTFRNLKHQLEDIKYQFRAMAQILELLIKNNNKLNRVAGKMEFWTTLFNLFLKRKTHYIDQPII